MGNLLLALEAGERLTINPSWPPHIRRLMTECWMEDRDKRPSFATILNRLKTEDSTRTL